MAERAEIKLAGANLGRARHVCAIFSDQDEVTRILLPFTREGLAVELWIEEHFLALSRTADVVSPSHCPAGPRAA